MMKVQFHMQYELRKMNDGILPLLFLRFLPWCFPLFRPQLEQCGRSQVPVKQRIIKGVNISERKSRTKRTTARDELTVASWCHISLSMYISLTRSLSLSNIRVDFSNIKVGKTRKNNVQSGTRKLPYELYTKEPSSIFSPPEYATGTAVHRVDTTRI